MAQTNFSLFNFTIDGTDFLAWDRAKKTNKSSKSQSDEKFAWFGTFHFSSITVSYEASHHYSLSYFTVNLPLNFCISQERSNFIWFNLWKNLFGFLGFNLKQNTKGRGNFLFLSNWIAIWLFVVDYSVLTNLFGFILEGKWLKMKQWQWQWGSWEKW